MSHCGLIGAIIGVGIIAVLQGVKTSLNSTFTAVQLNLDSASK